MSGAGLRGVGSGRGAAAGFRVQAQVLRQSYEGSRSPVSGFRDVAEVLQQLGGSIAGQVQRPT